MIMTWLGTKHPCSILSIAVEGIEKFCNLVCGTKTRDTATEQLCYNLTL